MSFFDGHIINMNSDRIRKSAPKEKLQMIREVPEF